MTAPTTVRRPDGVRHVVEALDAASASDEPYRHLLTDQLFTPADADAALTWLEEDAEWWVQSRSFYEHDTCQNISACPLDGDDGPLGLEARAAIASVLERRLGIPLDRDHPTLGAHRMSPGHGIGIHSDSPELGTEHVRLVVTLRRGQHASENGGELLLFDRPDVAALGAVVRPVHNSAVAFALTSDSYHAVNDVLGGDPRYSLVFGFWNRDAMRTATLPARARRSVADLDRLPGADALCDLLQAAGAGSASHSGATLLDHLVGVAATLVDWGCEPDICRAGLFHSVYGTATYRHALFSEGERDLIRATIGERSERLVWLFRTVRFSDVYRADGDERFVARQHDDGSAVELDRADIAALNLIACANMIDQMPEAELSAGSRFHWRNAMSTLWDLVPDGARAAMTELFEDWSP